MNYFYGDCVFLFPRIQFWKVFFIVASLESKNYTIGEVVIIIKATFQKNMLFLDMTSHPMQEQYRNITSLRRAALFRSARSVTYVACMCVRVCVCVYVCESRLRGS